MRSVYREAKESFQSSIKADILIVGKRLPFAVYIQDKGITKCLFEKGMVFTNAAREVLREKGYGEITVEAENSWVLESYISEKKKLSAPPEGEHRVFRHYSFHKEQHYQIDKTLLIPGTLIPFSIYALNKLELTPLVNASEKDPAKVDEKIFEATGDFVIRKPDIPLYHDYLNALLKNPAPSGPGSAASSVKPVIIKEHSKIVMRDLLEDPRSGEHIKESKTLVNTIIDCIFENKEAIYDLLSLRNYDYYTYTHSVNVAVMSVGLGNAIRMSREDIERLGIGALLHDVGKSAISQDILNKQGKLTDAEYQVIKSHVIESERILRNHKDIPDESFDAVLQHHEKLSGKGYPFKLSGREIKLFGRISAIADCYDALTTNRPYRPAYTPFYALSIISKETGDYDSELLKAFILMLGKIK